MSLGTGWLTTIQLNTLPRPHAFNHSTLFDRQCGHIPDGGKRGTPHSAQRSISSWCSRQPFQNGAESTSGTGMGLPAWLMTLFPQDKSAAAGNSVMSHAGK